jgi:hypothetical protein
MKSWTGATGMDLEFGYPSKNCVWVIITVLSVSQFLLEDNLWDEDIREIKPTGFLLRCKINNEDY